MPLICPIPALQYAVTDGPDLSARIAPPYDVLNEASKQALLDRDQRNIVAVDLPHLPPKTVGPDAAYEGAADLWRQWRQAGVIVQRKTPALFVYQQTYDAVGRSFQRRGLIANVPVMPFGKRPDMVGATGSNHQQPANRRR
jgi:uncharacterized protein (DUF1015 family)